MRNQTPQQARLSLEAGVKKKPVGKKWNGGWSKWAKRSLPHREPKAIGVAVARVAGTILGRRGFREATLLSQWSAIVGPEVAAGCLPTRLIFHHGGQRKGVLLLRVSSGSFALELQHRTVLLIERINTYFGHAMVDQIRIIQGVLPQRPPPVFALRPIVLPLAEEAALAAEVASVGNDALRAALARLGRSILYRRDQEYY